MSALLFCTKIVTQTTQDIQYNTLIRMFYIYSGLVNASHWLFNKGPLSVGRKYHQFNRVHVVFVEAILFTYSLSCTVYFTLLLTFCVCVAFVKILLKVWLKFKRSYIVICGYCIRPSQGCLKPTPYTLTKYILRFQRKLLASSAAVDNIIISLYHSFLDTCYGLNICLWKFGRGLLVCTTSHPRRQHNPK